MDRKSFIKKTVLTGGALAASLPMIKAGNIRLKTSDYDRLLEPVGFNHLPNKEETTMNTVFHKADTRGKADHGWLKSYHTFSFANYHNPERVHFGVLRVLNDDTVSEGMGFGTHPHDNMEIISIPLEGELEHKDSMGTVSVIKEGEIQVMSAGTGIFHSEYNKKKDQPVKFLQIWIFPNQKNVTPRYDQISLKTLEKNNEFYQVLSPNANDAGVWIHQNAWFHLGKFDKDAKGTYTLKQKGNGMYFFVLEGSITVENQLLEKRDGFGVWNTQKISYIANTPHTKVLLMDVPMTL